MPKLKTRKTAVKRLKLKKRRILREVRGVSHLRAGKTASQRKRTKKARELNDVDIARFKKMIPGLK